VNRGVLPQHRLPPLVVIMGPEVAPIGGLIEEIRFTDDSPVEEDEFELVVPDFRETFLLYRFRAANWPGATAGFDDR
jgi:hypothetical protein